MRTKRQSTVSGNRITIAINNAKTNAAINSQAVHLMTQEGGSCGASGDAVSSASSCVNCELIESLSRSRVAGSKGNSTSHAAPLTHHGCQSRQHCLFQAQR